MTDVLNVAVRSETGTKVARRLRREGLTPAILYGHGEENVNLSVPTAELDAVIRHGTKMVDLSGGVSEKALIRAVQWDAFGSHILHLDLNRVSEGEKVTITVPIEVRGEAPGSKLGGLVEQHLHGLEIECPAGAIPDRLTVSIKALELGDSISVGNISVPESVTVLTDTDSLVVSCQAQGPSEDEEEGTGTPGAGEPEVIGRKAEDEENAD